MSNTDRPAVTAAGARITAGNPSEASPADPSETVLSLQNVARMFNVPQLTLRYYELRGLIKRRHRIGQLPVYGWADCDRLAFIIKCRRTGLSLSQVAPIIAAVDHEDDVVIHKRGQEACMKLISTLEDQQKIVGEALAELAHTYSLLTTKLLRPETFTHHD
jgi:DNA-binding transcriptional MerR regulator